MTLAHGAGTAVWQFHAHPETWAPMIALLVGYALLVRRKGPLLVEPGQPPVTSFQLTSFVCGVLALWIASDWPIHELAENYLFSVHMVQHLLLTFVAPPLLLLGTPPWMLRLLLGRGLRRRIVRFFTKPVVALLLFNLTIAVTHWPAIVNLAVESQPAHLLLHAVLISTATAMWWPVVAPLPETDRLSEPAKMLYLFLQSIVPTVPASFLTFSTSPLYSSYEAVSHPWIGVVDDQQIAGLIMKIGGGLLLWGVIAVIFFKWNHREERGDVARAELTWEDFERDLEVWDLRK
jgi:putative membrane protein